MTGPNEDRMYRVSIPSADNTLPVLHEIRHALTRLLESDQETAIDLRNLPLGPAAINNLLNILGKGEVEAKLNALGTSLIRETRFPGVWLIEHFNTDEQLIGRFIEVTRAECWRAALPARSTRATTRSSSVNPCRIRPATTA